MRQIKTRATEITPQPSRLYVATYIPYSRPHFAGFASGHVRAAAAPIRQLAGRGIRRGEVCPQMILDAETYMNYNDRRLTQRYILFVFLYGALAHTDNEKRAV
jgi:hypothetical protein